MFFHKQKKATKRVVYALTDYYDNAVRNFDNDTDLKDYVDAHYTRIRQRDNFDFAKEDMFFACKKVFENDELVSTSTPFGEIYVKDETLKSLGFVNIEGVEGSELYHFARELGFRTLQTGAFGFMVHKEDIEKAKNIAQDDYKPFVLKGSDWPYWFKVNGKLIKSRTSSWKNYIYTQYGYLTEESLEEYNGPDKCKEHIDDSL
jgi:hypothetical protein